MKPELEDDGFVADDSGDGFKSDAGDDGFVADGEKAPEIHDPVSTFAINALDSASAVGVPTVLAAKDALFGEESAKASKRTDDDDPLFKHKGILDRYRQNKKFYKAGMQRASDESPLSALGGQLAPALIPGSALGKTTNMGMKAIMGREAVLGGVHGLMGGDADTAGGDIEGTLIDGAAGAGAGGVVGGLGAAGGKFIEYVGDKAGRRLSSEVSKRVASLLGKYGQKKKDAVAAMKNLAIQENMELAQKAPGAVSPAGKLLNRLKSSFVDVEDDLYDASAANAGKQVRRFVGSQNRFGKSGIPDIPYAQRLAMRNMTSQKMSMIKELAGLGARVAVGGAAGAAVGDAVGPSAGLSPGSAKAFGAAIGGGGALYVTRKLAATIMDHPQMLIAMSTHLPQFGRKLAAAGGNTGGVVGYLTALLATKQGRAALEASVNEVDSAGEEDPPPDDIELQSYGDEDAPKKMRAPGTLDKGAELKFDPFDQMPKHLRHEETPEERAAIIHDIGKAEYDRFKASRERKRRKYMLRPAPVPEVKGNFDQYELRRRGGSL